MSNLNMTQEQADLMIRAATKMAVELVLSLLESDPHQFGTRPCQTCTSVSKVAGRPFGCVAVRVAKEGGGR